MGDIAWLLMISIWLTKEGLYGVFPHYLCNVEARVIVLKVNGIGASPGLIGGLLAPNTYPQCQHMTPHHGARLWGVSNRHGRRPHAEEVV